MNYHNLREICDRYGLHVSYKIAGRWEEDNREVGLEYLLSVKKDPESAQGPIRVLGRVGLGELKRMGQDRLEQLVVGCSLMSMSSAEQ